MRRLRLYHWILIGLVIGVLTGTILQIWVPPGTPEPTPLVYRAVLKVMQFAGQIFMRLLQMVIIPLVVASIIVGTAGLGDLKRLGRMGARVLLYYTATTAIAVTIGLVWANTVRPGTFIRPEARAQLMHTMQQSERTASPARPPGLEDILLGLVPKNPIRSAAEGDMLPLIVFALLFGVGITAIAPSKARFMVDFFDAVTDVAIALVELIMKIAPIGVWGLMGIVVAQTGLDVLKPLLIFSIVVLAGLISQVVIVYTLSLIVLSREHPWAFYRRLVEAMLVAFTTSSSSATLPVSIKVAEKELGIPERIAGFVLPLGATINMDGTALYQGIVTVFLAQLFGIPLSIGDQLTIVLTATLASIGAAGVPSAGIITLIVVLQSAGINPAGIAIILGVDRILDMCRTVVNVTGDLVATRYVYAAEMAVGTAEFVLPNGAEK